MRNYKKNLTKNCPCTLRTSMMSFRKRLKRPVKKNPIKKAIYKRLN